MVVPDPCHRIDRLTHRADEAQRRQVVLFRPLGSPLHECTDGSRRRVENRDAVLFDERPEPIFLGPVGRAFVHQYGGAVGQWAVDDIAVASHPANIRRAPEHVLVFQIEHQLRGGIGPGEVTARGMDDSLGLPCRA